MTDANLGLGGAPVLVIGAGIMGAGIAQVAAQAGHVVLLFDARAGAAAQARDKLAATLKGLVGKGRLAANAAAQTLERIRAIDALEQGKGCALVIEAIVENLQVKRTLLAELEALVSPDCVLASNTSSLSITAMAAGLAHPQRLVGMHFFNPVPLMKLVEVVSGLHTAPEVAQAIFDLARNWDKVPVHARSTPGFIVNRIARPYYAEALALLQERVGTPEQLDSCLRAAGFRMGPCELMDLIGHDTNFAVTQSLYEANFYDKRYVPSPVQRELVDAGWLGRKSGRGFYDYSLPAPAAPAPPPLAAPAAAALRVAGSGRIAERIAAALRSAGRDFARDDRVDWCGLEVGGARLRLTDGRPASQLGAEIAVFDLPLGAEGSALAWAPSASASAAWVDAAPQWLGLLGFAPIRLNDAPGLVVARTIAMLINEAADAVQQGVCTQAGADAAMKLGVNYPAGPFEWLADLGAESVVGLLEALDFAYRGERYRVSPWLRQRCAQMREKT